MLPIILEKRKSRVRSNQAFNKLIAYVEGGPSASQYQPISQHQKFEDILNYTTQQRTRTFVREKCIAIRTNGVTDITSAAIEMNAVAARNTRCVDPAFHFVLTWPEHEHPSSDQILDAAEHAIRALGLAEHQYILAIHVDTDNIHCHSAVSRIHPQTFKSRNITWANRTIHRAARESELRHGWFHDNGIYIIQFDEQNNKTIVLNPEHDPANRLSRKRRMEEVLPAWHDPESLASWVKTKVAKALIPELQNMDSWNDLHIWLAGYGISLQDSGGGGLRLSASSQKTGEIINVAASRGLRSLKRKDLEFRWGKFTHGINAARPPVESAMPENIPEVSSSKLGSIRSEDRRHRREERTEQRAAARADLRRRFSQYQLFVREGDAAHFERLKEIRRDRLRSINSIDERANAKKQAVRDFHKTDLRGSLLKMAAIYLETAKLKQEVEADFGKKRKTLQASRTPALGWREWLYEQANMGDQAALSALRGIVYQARRDAKRRLVRNPALDQGEQADRAKRYKEILSLLIEEEKREIAIRSAKKNSVRPFEIDALLAQYVGLIWHVTGNGNIVYSDLADRPVFIDRGNRISFDRESVSDEDILLALAHAQQKFGKQVTLTGDDPVFLARMACLADDMGMAVLNPDLQSAIGEHRRKRSQMISDTLRLAPSVEEKFLPGSAEAVIQHPVQDAARESEKIASEPGVEIPVAQSVHGQLRAMVLAIDPLAVFEIPDTSNGQKIYSGPIVASCSSSRGFAQHIGRGVYALHGCRAPGNHNNVSIVVQYRNGIALVTLSEVGRGKDF